MSRVDPSSTAKPNPLCEGSMARMRTLFSSGRGMESFGRIGQTCEALELLSACRRLRATEQSPSELHGSRANARLERLGNPSVELAYRHAEDQLVAECCTET